jgi:hypothetical protein
MGAVKNHYFDQIVEGLGKTGTTFDGGKNINEFLQCKSIESRISYYEEKIEQWYLLESFGEIYNKSDKDMVHDWENTVKSLKEELQKRLNKN